MPQVISTEDISHYVLSLSYKNVILYSVVQRELCFFQGLIHTETNALCKLWKSPSRKKTHYLFNHMLILSSLYSSAEGNIITINCLYSYVISETNIQFIGNMLSSFS